MLNDVEHIKCMLFHLIENEQMVCTVEEHATHNLSEDVFRRAGESGVVEQMAGTMFGCGEEGVGQPADDGSLVETRLSLQEFHSMQHTAKLVLPPPTCGEELLENQCAIANGGFVPTEMTEVAESSQYCGSKNAACAESRTGRNGSKKRDFNAATKGCQCLSQGGMTLLGELREESAQS